MYVHAVITSFMCTWQISLSRSEAQGIHLKSSATNLFTGSEHNNVIAEFQFNNSIIVSCVATCVSGTE